ncbi:MAG: hypothetical protein WAU68_15680 [Vitreimonas sp.]
MTNRDNELRQILESEYLDPDGAEIAEIERVRREVETRIKSAFGFGGMSFRYGGSKAKGTILKSSYDLDLLCYFHRDNASAGSTLEDIYQSVARELGRHYVIDPRTTAIRLFASGSKNVGPGLRVDVVPGRFIEGNSGDVHLHQEGGEKDHLKTNPDVHINYVLNFEGHEELCALKLWRVKSRLQMRQFAFELLSIDLLRKHRGPGLSARVEAVLRDIAAMQSAPAITDPANGGNNLGEHVAPAIWRELQQAAADTIRNLPGMGWSGVLMTAPVAADPGPLRAAVRSTAGSKPWSE